MKQLFLIALLLCSVRSSGQIQLFEFRGEKNTVWQYWDAIKTDYQRQQTIPKIIDKIEIPFDYVRENVKKGEQLDSFHLIDINADGLNDVIFEGFDGGNEESLVFYINTGDTYQKSRVIKGRIQRIERSSNNSLLSFTIHDYHCCATFVDHILTLDIVRKESKYEFILHNDFAYMYDTEQPDHFISKTPFVTINAEYKLRAQPIIDNNYDNLPEEEIIDGNTVAIYPKGSRGYAIAKHTDETERIWWFVVMENNLKPLKSNLYTGNNELSFRSLGWMSSRYVKKLN
ncbi:MAG: hypothetical protein R8G66_31925 [Cytophagales bacterium]|nr:hypothetical protein [Cytophagales bacterium]